MYVDSSYAHMYYFHCNICSLLLFWYFSGRCHDALASFGQVWWTNNCQGIDIIWKFVRPHVHQRSPFCVSASFMPAQVRGWSFFFLWVLQKMASCRTSFWWWWLVSQHEKLLYTSTRSLPVHASGLFGHYAWHTSCHLTDVHNFPLHHQTWKNSKLLSHNLLLIRRWVRLTLLKWIRTKCLLFICSKSNWSTAGALAQRLKENVVNCNSK